MLRFTATHLFLLTQLYGEQFVTLYTEYVPRVTVCASFKKYFKDGNLTQTLGNIPQIPFTRITW